MLLRGDHEPGRVPRRRAEGGAAPPDAARLPSVPCKPLQRPGARHHMTLCAGRPSPKQRCTCFRNQWGSFMDQAANAPSKVDCTGRTTSGEEQLCCVQELARVLGSASYSRVVYVGDGRGDFCPVRALPGRTCSHACVAHARIVDAAPPHVRHDSRGHGCAPALLSSTGQDAQARLRVLHAAACHGCCHRPVVNTARSVFSALQVTRLGRNDVVLARTHYPTGTPCPLATALRTAGAQITAGDQGLLLRQSLAQQRPGAASGVFATSAVQSISAQHMSCDGKASASQKSAAAMPTGPSDQTAVDASHFSQGPLPHTDRASSKSSLSAADGSAHRLNLRPLAGTAEADSSDGQPVRARVYGWRTPLQLAQLLGEVRETCDEPRSPFAQGRPAQCRV